LNYSSKYKNREFKFRCFKDKDLKIADEFSDKIIHHTMDDDVCTEDEQLNLAIRNCIVSLKLAIIEEDETN